ncbi:Alpha-L-fucosidase [Forsythia ovata]|uniref:Alpha-L-fucosidase n=1 Tax=Forsythia ovata TaxID=205694 RepID=A0ABD1P7K3_9LAMI
MGGCVFLGVVLAFTMLEKSKKDMSKTTTQLCYFATKGAQSFSVYKLLGDVKLEFNDSHATYDEGTYKRVLDLDSARVKVEYSANEDFYVREYFALNPDQVLAIRFLEMNRLI